MTIKDIIQNIKFSRYHLCFEVTNPFEKAETEKKLNEFGLVTVKGYNEDTNATMYGVIDAVSAEKAIKFIEWFKRDDNWRWYESKNGFLPFLPKIRTYIR